MPTFVQDDYERPLSLTPNSLFMSSDDYSRDIEIGIDEEIGLVADDSWGSLINSSGI